MYIMSCKKNIDKIQTIKDIQSQLYQMKKCQKMSNFIEIYENFMEKYGHKKEVLKAIREFLRLISVTRDTIFTDEINEHIASILQVVHQPKLRRKIINTLIQYCKNLQHPTYSTALRKLYDTLMQHMEADGYPARSILRVQQMLYNEQIYLILFYINNSKIDKALAQTILFIKDKDIPLKIRKKMYFAIKKTMQQMNIQEYIQHLDIQWQQQINYQDVIVNLF